MLKKKINKENFCKRYELYGVTCFTNAELLSIILGVDASMFFSKNKSGLEGFAFLEYLSIPQLVTFPGIGKTKAMQIKAVLEVCKRFNLKKDNVTKIKSPEDIYNVVKQDMEYKKQEIIKTVILNKKNIIQAIVTNAVGGQSKIVITPKEILSEPLKQMASAIIIVHNHPSGDPTPSSEDVSFTKHIISVARLLDIDVLDHLVIGNNCFRSLKRMNLM